MKQKLNFINFSCKHLVLLTPRRLVEGVQYEGGHGQRQDLILHVEGNPVEQQ